jgi:hypothetical protein
MVTESKRIYAGTVMEGCFLMFHGALSAWNEAKAKGYIKARYLGFENRFIKPAGTTRVGTIYKDKPPGNSPENARGLDSIGFADLEYAMSFNCALSWHCPYGDHRRIFGQGTLHLPRLAVLVSIEADRPWAWFPGPLGPYAAWFSAI